jgi:predicted Zn-dependent protease
MPPPEEPSPEPLETPQAPNPRALASLELSKQAERLIEAGRLDEGIRILERAVNLHPGSGENYYYLAEAWRLKGNAGQAAEYNTLASIRFREDPQWMRRLDVQRQRIEKMR